MSQRKIKISAGNISINAELNESDTARKIWDILPVSSEVNTWGDEIYFSIPVRAELENPVEVVEIGDLGYWPPGQAFCIFFGKTPASTEDEIKPASAVSPVGTWEGDPSELMKILDNEKIVIEKLKRTST